MSYPVFRTHCTPLVLLVALLGFVVARPAQAQSQPQTLVQADLPWKPFDVALKDAQQNGKKIVIDIYAIWCGWCRKMQEETYTDPELQKYLLANFELVRLDIEEEEQTFTYKGHTLKEGELAYAFGGRSTPTTVFMDEDGTLLTYLPGYQETASFRQLLEYIATDAYENQTFASFTGKEEDTSHVSELSEETPRPSSENQVLVQADIPWTNFSDALATAKQSGKKVLLDIYAIWCGWCRKMQEEVYGDAAIQKYLLDHFVIARLDIENQEVKHDYKEHEGLTEMELSYGLGAQGTPTTVFLTTEGEYINRLPGYADAETFMHILTYIATDAYESQKFTDYLEAQKAKPQGE